ncbi:MAG: o-succinylbenzoate synthase [Chlamydiae bacterium]|nr:o-succinylbenzoate synthase [Chlamydiota bacterium]
MKISFSPYKLQGRSSFDNREGVLLRFQFEDGTTGYADCHPWQELGDQPLKKQLSLLRGGMLTSLTQRSLYFAGLDAGARLEGESLFSGFTIPPSHWLVSDFNQAIPDGFSFVKAKVGKAPLEEIPQLLSFFERLPENVKVRLDFNCRLSQEEFEKYLNAIRKWIEKIDFIEDPFPYHSVIWKNMQNTFGVRFACDHQSERWVKDAESHSVSVLKPAVQDEQLFIQERSIVVTSYLDHPVGQVAAAFVAANMFKTSPDQLEPCGLLSHLVYQTNEFSEQLGRQGAVLTLSQGTGFGFDELLVNQDWKDL